MGIGNSKCTYIDCKNKVIKIQNKSKDKLLYCKIHKCQDPTCLKQGIGESSYCEFHKCGSQICNKPSIVCGYCNACFMSNIR
jgi:hypothetical protein